MYTKSCNIKVMIGDATDGIIDELRKSLLQNYKKDLKQPMIGNDFVFLIVLIYCIIIFKK